MKVKIKDEFLTDVDDEGTYEVFGKSAKKGEAVEVDDRFAEKAKRNHTLEVSGAPAKGSESEKGGDGEGEGDGDAPVIARRPVGRPAGR